MRTRLNKSFFLRKTIVSTSSIPAPSAYWALEDVVDVVGARNFTQSSGSFAPGKISNCFSNVSSGTLTRASDSTIDLATSGTSYSLAGWLNWTSSFGNCITKGNGSTTGFLWAMFNSSGNFLEVAITSSLDTKLLTTSMSIITWTHIAMIVDRSNQLFKMYKNGVSQGTVNISGYSSGNSSGSSLILGSQTNMKFDEFGLWQSYALTDSDISFLYNSGSGRTYNGSTWS